MKQEKVDRRSQRTCRLVSSAFAELLSERPYDEILVQDILDRAGIGRTTFYAHYFDKEDVLNSMIAEQLEMFKNQIADAPARQHAHYFDKEDVLNSMTAGQPEISTYQAAHVPVRQQIVPSLELFEHIYHSPHQQFRVLMRSRAGEPLWEALQTALCQVIEPALCTLCAEKRSPSIPLPVVSQYLAGTFFTLLKWWLAADMPYPPEQMESIFQRLALPGVWAMLKEK